MSEHFEMKCLLLFVVVLTSWSEAQNGRGPPAPDRRNGWDIRLAVPGEPGNDYPTLSNIPRTRFSCAGKEPGYYADVEARCQVFRVCTTGSTYGFQSFVCPNGTLFNQDVFVCDWWMNVKCRDYEPPNTGKFGNLRLGPELMKDIKKMLTHTMRNPYDKSAMKSNLVVMQDYRPPPGQLFPNGALLAGPERNPSNVYVPAKQIQPFIQNFGSNDITFAASTPDTRYIPAGFTSRPFNADSEILQRQSSQYLQPNNIQATQQARIAKLVQNGQSELNKINTEPRMNPNYNNQIRYGQKLNAAQNLQRAQLNRQRSQNIEVKKQQVSVVNQNLLGAYTKQPYHQDKQTYTFKAPIQQLPKDGNVRKFKENLVSTPSTIVTKTLVNSNTIQNPSPNKPKSRITIKTWIVKPSKSGRLVAEPATPYNYNKPTPPATERLVDDTTTYVYNRPTQPPAPQRLVADETPYVYNKPTSPPPQRLVTQQSPTPYVYNPPSTTTTTTPEPARFVSEDVEPYVYDKPTFAPKQILSTQSPPDRGYLPPSRPSQSALLIQTSPATQPAKSSRVILPTTFKPLARFYLPPSSSPALLPQYLSPIRQTPYYQNSQIQAAPTTPTPTYALPESPNPSVLYNNPKNLTFTDILTKEKLDLTVNDIVKDTGKILQTASPPEYETFNQNLDYPDEKYLPTETSDSGESLTSQSPSTTSASKSARLTAPSQNLEPPFETFDTNQNVNPLSSLPFYKEPAVPNTIERTVSLKITIPEKVASYLFKGGNDTDFDRLEILNTGSSNYLVLSNNYRDAGDNIIPLGSLANTKTSNVSQALVFSILADSLNAAKQYNNLVKQDITSTTQTPQLYNNNDEDLSQITNKVSQLTSSQYSSQNTFNVNNNNQVQGSQSPRKSSIEQEKSNAYTEPTNTNQQAQSAQYNRIQKQLISQYQDTNDIDDFSKQNQIYSGQLYQLPVPEVTRQIYNRPQSADFTQQKIKDTPQVSRPNTAHNNNLEKQSNAEVEIVNSETLPLNPAKLQLASTNEPESFYTPESLNNLLNSDNGISAQLQDKIVGVIPHPLEDNKVLTYEKDQSYYLYTKLNNNGQIISAEPVQTKSNYRFVPENKPPNVITFQFVPSVSYQLEDEKDQQKLLNTFQIDEFGAPREIMKANLVQGSNQRGTIVSNIDYTVQHPSSKQISELSHVNTIYKGPSSYSAPQGSVGNLVRQSAQPRVYSERIEELNDSSNSEGYPKSAPTRRFVF